MSTADDYVNAIKNGFKTVFVGLAMGVIVSAVPPLGLPWINWLIRAILDWIIGLVLDKAEMLAFFGYIDLRTSMEGRDFEKTALEKHSILLNGTDKEKEDAEKELIEKFRRFGKFTT